MPLFHVMHAIQSAQFRSEKNECTPYFKNDFLVSNRIVLFSSVLYPVILTNVQWNAVSSVPWIILVCFLYFHFFSFSTTREISDRIYLKMLFLNIKENNFFLFSLCMKPILKHSVLTPSKRNRFCRIKINIITFKEQIENYQHFKYKKNVFINISKIHKLDLCFKILLVSFFY